MILINLHYSDIFNIINIIDKEWEMDNKKVKMKDLIQILTWLNTINE